VAAVPARAQFHSAARGTRTARVQNRLACPDRVTLNCKQIGTFNMLESGARSNSAPVSPSPDSLEIARGAENDRYEIENEHLRQCVSMLQYELRNVRAAALSLHESLVASQLKVSGGCYETCQESDFFMPS
jgi:hypothetical protein